MMKLLIFGSSDRDTDFPSEALVKLMVDWPGCEVDRNISTSALECS